MQNSSAVDDAYLGGQFKLFHQAIHERQAVKSMMRVTRRDLVGNTLRRILTSCGKPEKDEKDRTLDVLDLMYLP
ncbi:unnamed protein product [Nippostrongylus brasiliensis]|uniref:Transcriptional regulator n=1 Tax=Nippostrongylus brasiliensis TaxID=27835 RepID=A0A0N4XQY4_NIPBR|nr:unnamed protein product [Nippostrongylus brasiliensis]